MAVLVGLATATWLQRKSEWSLDAFAWPMAASLLCAPVVFPWYLLWLLPFLTSPSTLPVLIWTVCIIPVYVQWHLSRLEGTWGAPPGWIMLVEYGCLAIAVALLVLPRIKDLLRSTDKAARGVPPTKDFMNL
jgi:cellulose synthase/poly-beta-1,6-N-acetylglucosamine synthase-like glycosyltransferase